MTLQELCKKYQVAETSVLRAFPRTQAAILKKYGIRIKKEGRGKNAQYYEIIESRTDPARALTIYKEVSNEISLSTHTLSLANWNFITFLAIAIAPMGVFRGSYIDFLNYIEIKPNESNINLLKQALTENQSKDLIEYTIDKTDNNYFVAFIYSQVEKEMQLGIKMVKDCKHLQEKYNKKSWVPILKTWISIELLGKHGQIFKMEDIHKMTGLSYYQIRENMKLLKDSTVFQSSKIYKSYDSYYCRCLGTQVDISAFNTIYDAESPLLAAKKEAKEKKKQAQ